MTRPRTLLTVLAAALLAAAAIAPTAGAAAKTPPVKHVFVIVLENENAADTFGAGSEAPYLAKTLTSKGVFVPNYYGTTHFSLGNYTAMISGQGPTPQIQADCGVFAPFVQTGTGADGQALGTGCVYPKSVPTLAGQLTAKKLKWRGYMEDMGNNPQREAATCGRPALGAVDGTQKATKGDQYAARHNPFAYFLSISAKDCAANVVALPKLTGDLKSAKKTANYTFITPNLCHDGHDEPCVDGQPGGLVSANAFLQSWVPKILKSPAYKKDGMLIVTFDEAEAAGAEKDASGCCNPPKYPNVATNALLGGAGTGGGRIGAVILSKWTKGGKTTPTAYNHFSFLASVERLFGLKKLGYAGRPGLTTFGKDVFNK